MASKGKSTGGPSSGQTGTDGEIISLPRFSRFLCYRLIGWHIKYYFYAVSNMVESIRKHKKFKQLVSFSVQCLEKVSAYREQNASAAACSMPLMSSTPSN
jgi:hypothetical protein